MSHLETNLFSSIFWKLLNFNIKIQDQSSSNLPFRNDTSNLGEVDHYFVSNLIYTLYLNFILMFFFFIYSSVIICCSTYQHGKQRQPERSFLSPNCRAKRNIPRSPRLRGMDRHYRARMMIASNQRWRAPQRRILRQKVTILSIFN